MSGMPDSTFADPKDHLIADLQRQLAASNAERDEALAERDEALARETATAEVLQVINSSPGDLAPVFDALLEKAMRRCNAAFGELHIYEGDRFRPAAMRGLPPALREFRISNPPRGTPGTFTGRILSGADVVQIEDLKAEQAYLNGVYSRRGLVDLGGARSAVGVALRKEGILLGVIFMYRQTVHPFSGTHIALLQNFAAQAVIAMENARLLAETREALAQQTATAEVLGVINSSRGDLAPVFNAMLEKAMYLCEGGFGAFFSRDGDLIRPIALRNMPSRFMDYLTNERVRLQTMLGPEFENGPIIHISDLAASDGYQRGVPLAVAAVEWGKIRTFLVVPLLRRS
jgi:hypothetical protein